MCFVSSALADEEREPPWGSPGVTGGICKKARRSPSPHQSPSFNTCSVNPMLRNVSELKERLSAAILYCNTVNLRVEARLQDTAKANSDVNPE